MSYKDPIKQKEVHKEYARKHYLKYKEIYNQRSRAASKAKKEWLAEIKDGLSCIQCGESRNVCLDFHHRDPKEKDMGVNLMLRSFNNKERVLKEIAKCDVLCANCHRAIHEEERVIYEKERVCL